MIEAAADLQLISASVSTVAVLQLTTVMVHLSVFFCCNTASRAVLSDAHGQRAELSSLSPIVAVFFVFCFLLERDVMIILFQ